MVQMEDGVTCMAFTVSFVPNTGNKYFLAAADENLRLYDFENAAVSRSKTQGTRYLSTIAVGLNDTDMLLATFLKKQLLQTFENMYSSYCDCGKFIQAVDFPLPPPVPEEEIVVPETEQSESSVKKGKMKAEDTTVAKAPQQFAYFISRGVELLDSEERMIGKNVNRRENVAHCHRYANN